MPARFLLFFAWEASWLGKSWKTGEIPQPEAIEKQAGLGEKLENRENPPTGMICTQNSGHIFMN